VVRCGAVGEGVQWGFGAEHHPDPRLLLAGPVAHVHPALLPHAVPSNEIKLVNVAEMDYLVTDTMHGTIPCLGRGELCNRGPNVFAGYYHAPDKTAEAIDADGWLHSGDIAIVRFGSAWWLIVLCALGVVVCRLRSVVCGFRLRSSGFRRRFVGFGRWALGLGLLFCV
jgi:acyl-CoA synthetase (AMP-forming)/AMP-acid ligase II